MERRRDVDTQKTQTSVAVMEEQKENHVRRNDKPGAHVDSRVAVEKQAQYARKAVHRSSQVRAGKIEALRAQIETSTYQIDCPSLAMKLLGITEQDAD
jgi:anti-sigma28 factor (negative regulator of flagellin synthesis)